eukprot:765110-Hanusia_phi.AAC.12
MQRQDVPLLVGQGCASFDMPGEDLQHDAGPPGLELLSRRHHEMRVRLIKLVTQGSGGHARPHLPDRRRPEVGQPQGRLQPASLQQMRRIIHLYTNREHQEVAAACASASRPYTGFLPLHCGGVPQGTEGQGTGIPWNDKGLFYFRHSYILCHTVVHERVNLHRRDCPARPSPLVFSQPRYYVIGSV